MFYVYTRINMHPGILRFATLTSAIHFVRFCNRYADESGAGNGYDAYWYARIGAPPLSSSVPVYEALKDTYLVAMARMLAVVRPMEDPEGCYRWHRRNGFFRGIVFSLRSMPAPMCPVVGEMYRIPRSRMSRDMRELSYAEGRVIREEGKMLYLQASSDELALRRREIQVSPPGYSIRRNRVVRIPDWIEQVAPTPVAKMG